MLIVLLLIGAGGAAARGTAAEVRTGAILGPESPYLSGRVPFSVRLAEEIAGRTAMVNWYLDGRLVLRSTAPPYRVIIDLGPDVLPHRITATAYTDTAEELWTSDFRTLGLSVAYSDRVALVVVPVTVLHPDGYFVTGLTREDFRVYEEGRRQELTCFGNDVVPLSMALLIDCSESMRGRVREIRKAARSLIERLSPEDAATVMSFNDDLVRHCEFTGDKRILDQALDVSGPVGGTALYDALYGASRAFRTSGSKRVIILFTDGRDEKYRRPAEARRRLERALSAASRANITVYTIGLGQEVDEETMGEIADTTGGAYFHLRKIRDLAGAYGRIFEELGSQYTLCYQPEAAEAAADDSWRSIRVEVDDPDYIVRYKKGYSPSR